MFSFFFFFFDAFVFSREWQPSKLDMLMGNGSALLIALHLQKVF